MKNVSLESTTMKTMYDTGHSVNELCHKVKMPNDMEQIKKGKDIALVDRSTIILAMASRHVQASRIVVLFSTYLT